MPAVNKRIGILSAVLLGATVVYGVFQYASREQVWISLEDGTALLKPEIRHGTNIVFTQGSVFEKTLWSVLSTNAPETLGLGPFDWNAPRRVATFGDRGAFRIVARVPFRSADLIGEAPSSPQLTEYRYLLSDSRGVRYAEEGAAADDQLSLSLGSISSSDRSDLGGFKVFECFPALPQKLSLVLESRSLLGLDSWKTEGVHWFYSPGRPEEE